MREREWLIRDDGVSKRALWVLPPELELTAQAEVDILLACRAARGLGGLEISGLGRIVEEREGHFVVSDIVIPYQMCGSGHTRLSGAEVTDALDKLEQEGKNLAEYRNFWWHSHVNGEAYFSGTDNRMIYRRMEFLLTLVHASYDVVPDETIAGPFFSLVANVRGDMRIRCDFVHRQHEKISHYTFEYTSFLRPFTEYSQETREALMGERATARIGKLVRERVSHRRRRLSLFRRMEF